MNSKQALSRPTSYETAKMLMDRKDNIERVYTYPKMTGTYPKVQMKKGAGLYGFMQSILP